MKKEDIYKKESNRKHRFLVGYVGDGNVFYDMREEEFSRHYVMPLTFLQAKRALKKLESKDAKVAIYEVVPKIIVKL